MVTCMKVCLKNANAVASAFSFPKMAVSTKDVGRQINKDGFGKEYLCINGEYYEGKFVSDRRDGQGMLINFKGEVFRGQWKSNKKVLPMEVAEKMNRKE
mmetsp:Transcript_12091/g.13767  ORF Transcript_12091/g.13767 Transcript_12091/m.13767 type:complete len:99 (-) Transcript_12091:20-316(-)